MIVYVYDSLYDMKADQLDFEIQGIVNVEESAAGGWHVETEKESFLFPNTVHLKIIKNGGDE